MQTSPESSKLAPVRPRARVVVVLAAVAAAAVLSACGSKSSTSSTPVSTTVNTAQVARSIEQNILAQRHLRSTVVCPTTVAAEKGKTFRCTATTRSVKKPAKSVKTSFLVTVQNNRGGVSYVGQ
jgi:hypothetical protein